MNWLSADPACRRLPVLQPRLHTSTIPCVRAILWYRTIGFSVASA
jgi:hypothetical protein